VPRRADRQRRRRALASFETGNARELRAKLEALLALSAEERRELGLAARGATVERWSWTGVARRLLVPLER